MLKKRTTGRPVYASPDMMVITVQPGSIMQNSCNFELQVLEEKSIHDEEF